MICATNRDLKAEETRGNFRLDFYHRIAAVTVNLPPLRERREDILPLANHFFGLCPVIWQRKVLIRPLRNSSSRSITPAMCVTLRQLVLRIAKRHVGPGPTTVGDIPEDDRGTVIKMTEKDWTEGELEIAVRRALAKGVRLPDLKEKTAEVAIEIALRDAQGNVQRAAIKLGVTDRALQMRRASRRGNSPAVWIFAERAHTDARLPRKPVCFLSEVGYRPIPDAKGQSEPRINANHRRRVENCRPPRLSEEWRGISSESTNSSSHRSIKPLGNQVGTMGRSIGYRPLQP